MSDPAVLTWIDASGVETELIPTNGFRVLQDPSGLGVPSPTLTVEDFVAFDGSALVSARRAARGIVLPLEVTHPTRVMTRLASLARMVAAGGSLRWDDGVNVRTLTGLVYEGGLTGDGDPTQDALTVTLSLVAMDPWWYGDEVTESLTVTATTGFSAAVSFGSASVPFNGGGVDVLSVPGDTEAFPVVTVVGPFDELTVGIAGGLDWSLASPLAAGYTLVMDSRPGRAGPRLNGGAVDWSLLTPTSRRWLLPVGSASVVVGAVGSSGGSSVELTYEPRYLTP